MKSPRFTLGLGMFFGFARVMTAEIPSVPAGSVVPATVDNPAVAALRAELEAMGVTDQSQRKLMSGVEKQQGPNSAEMRVLWKTQGEIDARNIVRLEEIIAQHGWPKRSVVGASAASAAFLILQHADISYQKKYVALAREAVVAKEMDGSSLALLEDRILLREGKKQIYGSQVRRNEVGDWEVSPIEDEANVDQRRVAVGLQPLAQYLQGFADRGGGKVADRKDDLPVEGAPPLVQSLFAETDDAREAHAKLRKTAPQRAAAGVQFQLACRDFCARFSRSSLYGTVRVLAANYEGWFEEADRAQLQGWDPAAGETDPKLTAEQRAEIALHLASAKGRRSGGAEDADKRLDLIATALAPHRKTEAARNGLVAAALDASAPQAIARLHENYPGDPAVGPALGALELLGKPGDLKFTTFDGRAFDLRELKGKVVFVAFVSTGGGDWLTTLLADVKKIAGTHGAENFSVVGVSLANARSDTAGLLNAHAITWPIYWDASGWRNPLVERFVVKIAPYYLLYDRQGVLRFRGPSPTSETARKRIETLIAEK